ncbi:response regulator [Flavobacterium pallidum]|uniref:Response regulator n=1 Tax=Flavobacterium pallidum TaxID=2172098 RepID=A0A2S1SJD9_9FLAO|nr:response regulator [Flavobacterium pallidum]AWI26496.1 response regulator [Flavobacterium pallidum]
MTIPDPNTRRHIVMADDDEEDRMIFSEILLEIDDSVIITQAENGKQLMDFLNGPVIPHPHVILLDLNMPVQNGFECLQQIRNERNLKELNIVVYTTSDHPDTIKKAKNLGATFYAVKPNSLENLRSLVTMVLAIDWRGPVCERSFRLI